MKSIMKDIIILPIMITLATVLVFILPVSTASHPLNTIDLILPPEATVIISTSHSNRGMLVTYKTSTNEIHSALYPEANNKDRPTFIFNFVKEE